MVIMEVTEAITILWWQYFTDDLMRGNKKRGNIITLNLQSTLWFVYRISATYLSNEIQSQWQFAFFGTWRPLNLDCIILVRILIKWRNLYLKLIPVMLKSSVGSGIISQNNKTWEEFYSEAKAFVICRCCLKHFDEGVFKSFFLVTFYFSNHWTDSLPVWTVWKCTVISVNRLVRKSRNRVSQTWSRPGEIFFHFRSRSPLFILRYFKEARINFGSIYVTTVADVCVTLAFISRLAMPVHVFINSYMYSYLKFYYFISCIVVLFGGVFPW